MGENVGLSQKRSPLVAEQRNKDPSLLLGYTCLLHQASNEIVISPAGWPMLFVGHWSYPFWPNGPAGLLFLSRN